MAARGAPRTVGSGSSSAAATLISWGLGAAAASPHRADAAMSVERMLITDNE